jgi:LemA protein
MDNLEPRISEEIAPEVFALASRLYAQKNQQNDGDYSLAELMQAGAEAQIPPEFVQQAVQEIQAKRRRAAVRLQRLKLTLASVGVAIALWGIWTYNTLSNAAQKVDAAWAQVENQFQRRSDLIPNLVSVTQAHAQHERELATVLAHSRQLYLQANTRSEKVAAMREVSQAIEHFRDYAAKNPHLRSSQAFINLQYELAGTENRIAVERMRYNQAVQNYNPKVRLFPNSLLAGVFGFHTKPFFQSKTTNSPGSKYSVLDTSTFLPKLLTEPKLMNSN